MIHKVKRDEHERPLKLRTKSLCTPGCQAGPVAVEALSEAIDHDTIDKRV